MRPRVRVSGSGIAVALVLLAGLLWTGCESTKHPLEPSMQAAGAAGPTVKSPSNTNAGAVSESQIDITWQDNSSNETGFEVWRAQGGPGGPFGQLVATGANTTAHHDAGLAESTQYCYQVRSFRAYDGKKSYSAFSAAACATTPAPPPPPPGVPTAPSGLNPTPTNSWMVRVTWIDNATNEDGFWVQRSATNTGSWEGVIGLMYPDATGTTDFGRASEREVCYRVIAFNAQGNSTPSNVDCTTPPASPTNLTATAVDSRTVDLSWADNSGAEDGYEVLRSTDGMSFGTVASLPANSANYRDAGVSENMTYSYIVRARKDGGFSDLSNVASAAVGLLTPPAAPSLSQPEGYYLGTIWLYWSDGSNNQEGYKVESCPETTCNDADYVVIATTGPTVRSLQVGGAPGIVYAFRVRATNRVGDSAPSNVAYGRACVDEVDPESPCFP